MAAGRLHVNGEFKPVLGDADDGRRDRTRAARARLRLDAALVQFIDIAMKRVLPPLHAALGIFLPLITTNCAVLGVAEINCKQGTGFGESVFFSFAAALGFGFALVIFSGIREKLAHADPPRCFRGVALGLVTAGLLSLAFMGFSGMVKLPY